ncbi:hypothetical protein [Nocardiopsis dassonvillei]|uniref:hypothetical protein n=1 Tax=Nocardiopsis dassonvillei TaxID=2014 RepID=UPI00363EAAA6
MPTATAETTQASPATQQIRFAYVLTLQFPMGGMNHAVLESSGTVDLPSGAGRNAVFQQIRQNMIDSGRKQGVHGTPTTIFFSLERDSL